jgi:ABC-type uncharacterized transport system substrate-binding protein
MVLVPDLCSSASVTSLLGSALTENRLICQFREMVETGCLASYGIGLTTRLSCWSI